MSIQLQLAAFVVVASIFTSGAACAADDSGELGEVIVTATRYPVASERVLSDSFVINRDEIERSMPVDLADLLRTHAGIEIGRAGGPGQTPSIFMRGSDSNHTLVLLDGIRLNPGTIGSAALQNFMPELAQRVEVVKGPLSSIYGTDAIGGVINIITRDPGSTGISGSAGFGRYDTRTATVSGNVAGEAGHAGLSISALDTDGFPPQSIDSRGGAFDNLSLALNASTTLGAVELGARAWHSSGSVDYIGFSERSFSNALITQDYLDTAAAVFAAYSPAKDWNSKLTVSRMVDDIQQGHVRDDVGPNGYYESQDFAHTRRYTADWQNDVRVNDAQLLTLGVIAAREATSSVSFGTRFDVDTTINTFYAQDQLHWRRHDAVVAVGFTDHSTFGSHTTWNAQYGYEFPSATRLTGSIGTAFRAPDSTDRFGFGGNPDLAPETSRSIEFGLRQKFEAHQQVSLTAFRNDVDNLIEYVITDFVTFDGQNHNVAKSRNQGIELAYDVNINSWSARLEAIAQDPVDRSTDLPLYRRAKHNYTVALAKSFSRWQIGADVLRAGKRFDAGFPTRVELAPYTLVNLNAGFRLTAEWTLQARLENAFDEKYQLADTYNTPGRSVLVAARFSPRHR